MSKTVFITGGSRGIGKAIALNLAKKGYNIVIAAKTTEPHPNLDGTIYTAAEEIEKAGGKALPIQLDVRDEEDVKAAIEKTVETFGGIDILINNASALILSGIEHLPSKKYDLMMDINVKGSFLTSHYAIPHLKKSDNPHIINLSPPINLDPKWYKVYSPYAMSKMSMSMLILGLSEELKSSGVAANALWPKTTIGTAAVKNMMGGDEYYKGCRNEQIMADAAEIILDKNSKEFTGNFVIDEDILRDNGVTDFSPYRIDPNTDLISDLFL